MKLYTKKEILPIILILAIAAAGIYFFPQLPDKIPSHWNVHGEIDGWMAKTFFVWFFPALIAAIYLLLSFVPLMDPLKKNIELFARGYFWLKLFFVFFMGGLFGLTIYASFGHQINVGRFVLLSVAVLFFFLGLLIPKIKRNYTVGIRLPWTLHSDEVWEKTHKFGGKLFIALAVLLAAVAWLPGTWAFGLMLGGLFLILIILMGYSYWQWRILKKERNS